MNRYYLCLILLVQLYSCIGQSKNYNVLNDVICELLGDEYLYESFTKYYSDTIHKSSSYKDYITNRKLLNDSNRIIFINNFFGLPEGTKSDIFKNIENDSIFINNTNLKILLKNFISNCDIKKELDLKKINIHCGYHFAYFSDKRINKFKPSARSAFFISPIESLKNNFACFYFAGGRGDYSDYFVILKRQNKNWSILKKYQ